ncbi:MAG: dihydrofolate reductase, partial [Flammeovirgaceae bacterium]|nr:dihydrofolate reductase [Flammeovirgaceae bacterium]MDW8287963.1 dihydrofolate reductase [Flammeovirgaceae bacterium]
AHRLYITEVDVTLEGDAFFPPISSQEWKEISRVHCEKDEKNIYSLDFVVYERNSSD